MEGKDSSGLGMEGREVLRKFFLSGKEKRELKNYDFFIPFSFLAAWEAGVYGLESLSNGSHLVILTYSRAERWERPRSLMT